LFYVDAGRLSEVTVIRDCPHGFTHTRSAKRCANTNEHQSGKHHDENVFAQHREQSEEFDLLADPVVAVEAGTTTELIQEDVSEEDRQADRDH
jgi:hypothetical protein